MLVPDFRSSNGLFNILKSDNKMKASGKHLFDASVYQTDSSTADFHDMVRSLSTLVKEKKPTRFHEMLASIASEGRLMRLYTQNVDGLEASMPPLETRVPLSQKGPWPRTIQLHGSLEKMVCTKCSTLSPFKAEWFDGPLPPACEDCIKVDEIRTDYAGKRSHGIGKLRPRMVLYNEHNPDEEAIGRVMCSDLRNRPDAVIVVGTSMEIPGVKRLVREMCGVVRGRKDGLAVWINRNPPPIGKEFEDCWDLIVAGDCDQVARHANLRRWNEEGMRVTDSEAEKARHENDTVKEVVVQSPKKSQQRPGELMTPAPSPKPESNKKSSILIKLSGLGPPAYSKKTATKNSGILSQDTSNVPKIKVKRPSPGSAHQQKSRKKASSKISKPDQKINNTFKVKKSQAPAISKTGERQPPAKPFKPPHLTSGRSREKSAPMSPVSSGSALVNPPLPTTPRKAKELLMNLSPEPETSTVIFHETAAGLKGRLQLMSEEITSPDGTIPSGMEGLLH